MRSIVLLAAAAALNLPVQAQRPAPAATVRQAILIAEDSRGTSEADLAPLMSGLASKDPAVVGQAIRALGRFERAALVGKVAPFLRDHRVPVRVEAAVALGQLGQDSTATEIAAAELLGAFEHESEPLVLGALARSLGRLPGPAAEPIRTALVNAALTHVAGPPTLQLDLARALESMVRLGGPGSDGAALIERLKVLASVQGTASTTDLAAKIRRAAVAGLVRADRGDGGGITKALADRDPEVRRLAVLWASDTIRLDVRKSVLTTALLDADPMVRVEALRGWGRHFQAADCGPIIKATNDHAHHVALTAIDLLGGPCPAAANAGDVLWPMVDSLAGSQRGNVGTIASWHRGAHAMVSLAKIAPNRVRGVLSRAGVDQTWQVRMYGAVAAGIVGDPDRLRERLGDANDNVREAAIAGLKRVRGHGADSAFLAQLSRPDYQLIKTASEALAGTPDKPAAVPPLLASLARLTAERRENSRDPRLAILVRLREVGAAGDAARLEPYLTDFDPEVAAAAAGLMTQWTGQPHRAKPIRLRPPALVWAEIQRWQGSRLRVTMARAAGGGSFEIALYPETAPATVARVIAKVRAKYYDGLTFHRVVPNFVIQGGSPAANEYRGDGPFMRDEVDSRSHERGTLGISTRGRDTGDAQIFVNVVDNLRLDFEYTVWGRIVRGMDVVDSVLEGDQIERVDLIPK